MIEKNSNVISRNSNLEQVNLIDLVLQLWYGRRVIFTLIILSLVLVNIYIKFTKEKWISSSIITYPDKAQVADYNDAMSIIYGKKAPSITEVQLSIINQFNSSFLSFSTMLANKKNPEKLTINTANNTIIKEKNLPLKITYESKINPKDAQKGLRKYIQQIDEKTSREINSNLKKIVQQKIFFLSISLKNQEKIAKEQKDLHMKQISEALKFARDVKITTPQIQYILNFNQDSMFLLGSKVLSSMIRHESTRPIIYSSEYYRLKKNLMDVQKLNINSAVTHTYYYIVKPNFPVHCNNQERIVTLNLSVASLSLIIGSVYVLIRNSLKEAQKE